jgi:muramoyltetrapeptide carboxypeptidase
MLSKIRPGSPVAVVAPSGPFPEDTYRAGLAILAERYEVVHAPDPAAARGEHAYLAAPDRERAARFNEALRDERVGAIFVARGGYGASRILGLLDGAALEARRPVLIGFSDATALHAWAACRRVASVHGPTLTQLAELPAEDRAVLFDLLEGRAQPVVRGLERVAGPAGAVAHGTLLGGNLTLLACLAGTPHLPDLAGALILLEEIDEAPYRIDRMLTQLLDASSLPRAAGVVLGDLVRCDRAQGVPPVPTAALPVLVERLSPLGIPVVARAPFGHGSRNLALPLGTPARLDVDAGELTFPAH